MTPSAHRLPGKVNRDATLPTAAWAFVLVVLSGCYVHPWRSSSAPLTSVATGGTPLRVTTRESVDGKARRFVFSSARVEGDSLVGLVYEEYERVGSGPWSQLQRGDRDARVSVATADVTEVSRREREASAVRSMVLLVVIAAVVVGAYYGFLGYVLSGGS